MDRNSREVAAQAIIFAALGFRASLEVTVHLRSATLCTQLLPWLEGLNLPCQIEDFHREILDTLHGKMPREFQAEALWRGEAASFLGWAVRLFEKPDPIRLIDPTLLVQRLRILQPNAIDLISNAKLRSRIEIEDYCAFCLKVMQYFQLASLDQEGRAVVQRIHSSNLTELGLLNALHRQREIESDVVQLASNAPEVRGLYVVRALAAKWLLGQEA